LQRGVGADAYTICIGHKEGDSLVIDVVRGTSGKFNPQAVTKEYAALCKDYRITKVTGDATSRARSRKAFAEAAGAFTHCGETRLWIARR